jgi:hypothetical protein
MRYRILEQSKSNDGTFDCCVLQNNHDELLYCYNPDGEWEVMNYKNVNPLEYPSVIHFIKENFIQGKEFSLFSERESTF